LSLFSFRQSDKSFSPSACGRSPRGHATFTSFRSVAPYLRYLRYLRYCATAPDGAQRRFAPLKYPRGAALG
jgi:hypothetical protein